MDPKPGRVDADLQAEFPGLRLWWASHEVATTRTPRGLRERLAHLSGRVHGAQAVRLRTDPVPHAYRVFFRHVGLDPDTHRVPAEAAVVDRLLHGGFRSRGLVEDALLLATAETGVPLWALDEAAITGPLTLRPADAGERLGRGEYASDLATGTLVVADDAGPVAELFSDPVVPHAPGRATTAVRIFSVQVPGVPSVHVEEAFWQAGQALDSPG
jgi:DNA/RNA-binding domain of Phe-tRNA-synthetase-like protein